MMMADIAKLSLVVTDKLEDNSISSVNSEAPYSMVFGGKLLEQPIECGGRRNLQHDRLFDQFTQRVPFSDPSSPVVPLRGLQSFEKFFSVQADGVAKVFEVLLGNLDMDLRSCSFRDFRVKRLTHRKCSPDDSLIEYTLGKDKSNDDQKSGDGVAHSEILNCECRIWNCWELSRLCLASARRP